MSVPTYLCPNGKLLFSLPNEEALKYIISLSSAMTMEAHGKAAQTALLCSSQCLCKSSTKQWSLITIDRVEDMALQLKAWTTHSSRGPKF